MKLFDGEGDGVDFLHKLRADHLGDIAAAGSCHEDARVVGRDSGLCFHAAQKLEDLLGLARLMALIVLPQRLVGDGVDDDRLDGG